ncbi:T9SS type A sorting domain-containing protein [Lewinella sp. W8]|uniref:T9SS type A sorting domain-containing protein n=1 Tax=Lewinella sp. W8 TaxID=2528208 RepID=UPI00106747E2|nr:T9SS type A sorting domain-containing protein [Lewinella sp. W8]MTB53326.1 T9SS type A sorting domain-containing protein [Lewinella sp. W8]
MRQLSSLLLVFGCLISAVPGHAQEYPTDTTHFRHGCLSMLLGPNGNLLSDHHYPEVPALSVDHDQNPATNPSLAFSASIWMGGRDEAGGVRVAGQRYAIQGETDFMPGPILPDGSPPDSATAAAWARQFYVERKAIERLREDFLPDRRLDATPDASLLGWPARGNPYFEETQGFPLLDKDLAPFIDADGDGSYDPYRGDYPAIKGDRAVWWVINDLTPHIFSRSEVPLGFEWRIMVYGTDEEAPLLGQAVFFEITTTNYGEASMEEAYLGLWMDPDIGCFVDDVIRSHSEYDLAFAHNFAAPDFQRCPAEVESFDTTTNAALGVKVVDSPSGPDGEPLGLAKFMTATSGNCDYISALTSPSGPENIYGRLRGYWSDGSALRFGGAGHWDSTTGPPTDHIFDQRETEAPEWFYWRQCLADAMLLSVGPLKFAPGESHRATFALYAVMGLEFREERPEYDTIYRASAVIQRAHEELVETRQAEAMSPYPPLDTLGEESIFAPVPLPNPTSGPLQILNPSDQAIVQISVYDAAGRIVREVIGSSVLPELDLTGLPAGVYLIIIGAENGATVTRRVVKAPGG